MENRIKNILDGLGAENPNDGTQEMIMDSAGEFIHSVQDLVQELIQKKSSDITDAEKKFIIESTKFFLLGILTVKNKD